MTVNEFTDSVTIGVSSGIVFGYSRQTNLTDLSDLVEIKCNFKNNHNLEFKGKDYLIFPLLTRF